MAAIRRNGREYRLACLGFSPAEVEATGRLLALLGHNLKQRWRLAEPGEEADVAIANLDGDFDPEERRHGSIAYCARKPSQHRQAAFHLPLRSYELLNLLNSEAPADTPDKARPDAAHARRYRLRAWPMQANDWPREHWRVMAAIRRRGRTVTGIALQTGLGIEEVQHCLDQLERMDALDEGQGEGGSAPALAPPPQGWRELASRVAQLFGFAR